MKKIPVEEAVGSVLCHDITQIIPGKVKDRAFKKGHIITEEDVPVLLSLGKDHIYVWEKKEGYLHENEAAHRLANLAGGEGLSFSEVKEGKINFIADFDGLLKIDTKTLLELNSLGEIILATRHNNYPVKKGQKVAGTRVIPLVIEEEKIIKAEKIAAGKDIVKVIPFKKFKAGMVNTGNEIYYGRIKDRFGPVVERKLAEYECEIIDQKIVPDDSEKIAGSIEELIFKGAEMVICTGGMSVDPDDVTPSGIKKAGGEIVSYGAPVLPGAMFLLAYKGGIPILGLPGCVMYSKTTIFDLVLPRVLVEDEITQKDIAAYGHGGLCVECESCKYPACSFGKGW
ncbi:MAG: hypothetical protein PWQ96_1397 [Clostridia bacterium]|nr:hypothetical protein [Clostridia bacterium]